MLVVSEQCAPPRLPRRGGRDLDQGKQSIGPSLQSWRNQVITLLVTSRACPTADVNKSRCFCTFKAFLSADQQDKCSLVTSSFIWRRVKNAG